MKINRAKRKECSDAAKTGNLATVKRLLGDPDVKGDINAGPWTILHHAVFGDQLAVAEYLLLQGANPNASYPSADNDAPLHSAACRHRSEIAKLLVSFGADINQKNANGKTAGDIARESNDQPMADMLVEEAKRRKEQEKRRAEEQKRLEEENARQRVEQEKQRQAKEARRRAEEERRRPIIERRKSQRQCVQCGQSLGFFAKFFRLQKHSHCLNFIEPPPPILQCDCPYCKALVSLPADATGRTQCQCPNCHKSFNVEIE